MKIGRNGGTIYQMRFSQLPHGEAVWQLWVKAVTSGR
jgi:hypothetical protein